MRPSSLQARPIRSRASTGSSKEQRPKESTTVSNFTERGKAETSSLRTSTLAFCLECFFPRGGDLEHLLGRVRREDAAALGIVGEVRPRARGDFEDVPPGVAQQEPPHYRQEHEDLVARHRRLVFLRRSVEDRHSLRAGARAGAPVGFAGVQRRAPGHDDRQHERDAGSHDPRRHQQLVRKRQRRMRRGSRAGRPLLLRGRGVARQAATLPKDRTATSAPRHCLPKEHP
mmetsp:Transcript_30275/g.97603  ORF Transcript_30275/g.97603 Transcript_30275/m.97603 type:complete len:229 (-) Transcript_30275:28-714(-)